tara:strand:- start:9 stop:134 length:126 start_codon:yes stop_codon:yes gene_type:complete
MSNHRHYLLTTTSRFAIRRVMVCLLGLLTRDMRVALFDVRM